MFRMLDNAYYRDISIKTWELHGDPSTWRAQLETYSRKEPVFAILGGISNKPWQPIHDFCEDNKIPCLFPITDLPVISTTSWYTFYASKGYYQEGENAARHILGTPHNGTDRKVLQVVRTTPQSSALSAGFVAAWNESGGQHLQTVTVPDDQKLDAGFLRKLLQQHTPDTLVIWAGEEIIPELASLPTPAPRIYISSRYIGKAVKAAPQSIREKLFITYPFRLPEDESAFEGYKDFLTLGKLKQADEKRITTRTFSMIHLFLQGLKEIKLNYYRDTLLDVISMRPDEYLPDFERYSFGPGQRYASKGCYIVQLDSAATPRLVKSSDWVLH
jgi:ABC-type branched-subunit amino acid transport system substrate-binding protein